MNTKMKIPDGPVPLKAMVDGKKITVGEAFIDRDSGEIIMNIDTSTPEGVEFASFVALDPHSALEVSMSPPPVHDTMSSNARVVYDSDNDNVMDRPYRPAIKARMPNHLDRRGW